MSVQDQIRDTALRYGVDPSIALAVAKQESGFNQGARGAAGEVGIFQLMPGTAADLGVNPYSESENIQGGIAYLSQLYRQFGDWAKALAAYNGGPGNMARGTTPPAAWGYAETVLDAAMMYQTVQPSGTPQEPVLASILPSFEGVPQWTWLAGAGLLAVALVASRD